MINVPNLPPFKRMCVSIGNLPTAFMESMTYYEALEWLYKYLADTIIPTVNTTGEAVTELQNAFTTLENYVNNYFENLDVQEEINNKLDAMAESGELTDIIAQYLGLAGMLTFNTVAELKAAENITNGSKCLTLGYYNNNDGGKAYYKVRTITNSDTVDEKTIIALHDVSLVAELIKEDIMNVKQFGAAGDSTTDDTSSFDTALSYANTIYVNPTEDSYKVTHLVIPSGKSLIGNDVNKVQIDLNRGTDTVISTAGNFSRVENIFLNALDENRANNRFDLNTKNNVSIINCRFTGFRDTSTSNAWGILLTSAKMIEIKGCYFSNNTQSDIAIVAGCENIKIDSCDGLALKINMEPSDPEIDSVEITNCKIDTLYVLENQLTSTSIKNLTVKSCEIEKLIYDGGTTSLIDCIVKSYAPQNIEIQMGGILNFINTGNFSENLIDDPYINNFTPNSTFSTPWGYGYSTLNMQNGFSYSKIENENVLILNPSNSSGTAAIKHTPISIDSSKTYMLKVRAGGLFPSASNAISRCIKIDWLNNSNESLQSQTPSMFRTKTNTSLPLHNECLILKPYEGATKVQIHIRNTSSGVQSLYVASVELYEIRSNEVQTNQLKDLPINSHRIFKSDSPSSAMNYSVGDIAYYATPTTHIGQVRTVGDYNGTWKNFGDIAS